MTLKVATVFSGIGAPEQALKRLKIDYQLQFACDNGDIILDGINEDEELQKIKLLSTPLEKKAYVDNLYATKSRKTNFVKKSYLANYCIKDNLYFQNVRLLDGSDFKDKVDLFIGGSPCQSFSVIGRKGGLEDARGTLFYDYVRLVKEIQPEVFVYENVYGLTRHDQGRTWAIMQEIFKTLGYEYEASILDSRNFGIPQGRRRIFVVGFKNPSAKAKFEFPKGVELKCRMQDFLEENVAEGSLLDKNGMLCNVDGRKGVPDPKYFLSEKLLAYCLSPGTKNFMHKDAEIDLPIARALLSTMGNHHRSSVNNYVTTNGRVRALTPREAHRLMGFPDDYKIVVSKGQAYRQAGNSIVVDVLMALFRQICIAEDWNGKFDK